MLGLGLVGPRTAGEGGGCEAPSGIPDIPAAVPAVLLDGLGVAIEEGSDGAVVGKADDKGRDGDAATSRVIGVGVVDGAVSLLRASALTLTGTVGAALLSTVGVVAAASVTGVAGTTVAAGATESWAGCGRRATSVGLGDGAGRASMLAWGGGSDTAAGDGAASGCSGPRAKSPLPRSSSSRFPSPFPNLPPPAAPFPFPFPLPLPLPCRRWKEACLAFASSGILKTGGPKVVSSVDSRSVQRMCPQVTKNENADVPACWKKKSREEGEIKEPKAGNPGHLQIISTAIYVNQRTCPSLPPQGRLCYEYGELANVRSVALLLFPNNRAPK